MIDSHAHLSSRFCDVFEKEIEEVVKVGVKKIMLAASSLEESKENIDKAIVVADRLWASAGIHPQKTDPENQKTIEKQLELLEELVKNNIGAVKAIGETGLDYSPPPPEEEERGKEEQEKLFRGQIEIALKYNLPLIIHARKAVDEVIKILAEYPNSRGVFHCYAGGKKRIKRVLDLGDSWFFGVDGNVTYEVGLTDVVKEIPQDRLILETDSPFLTPVPHRGEPNQPSYVKYIYQEVAEIWGKSFEETEKMIDSNVKQWLGI